MSRLNDLQRASDQILREGLPAGIVGLIRELLEKGEPAQRVKTALTASIRRQSGRKHTLTELAVHAEIEAVAAELAARRN